VSLSSNVRDALLIVNPAAGGGRRMRQLEEARRIFRAAGIETELKNPSRADEATALARRAVADSRELVIACGGDGTLNAVVNGLACSQVPLAVLPGGTANVLAKELSLPWNLARAAKVILKATYRRIALGLAVPEQGKGEPRYFLSVAGAGADGALVSAVQPEFKRQAGVFAYWQEGLRQLMQYKFPLFRTQMAGSPTGVEASLVIVGRTKHYGGPFMITTGADLLQPEFELAFVTTRSAWRYLAYLPLLWAGQLRNARHVRFFKTSRLRCAPSDKSLVHVQLDGEPAGSLPVEFRIVPDALTLAIPDRR